MEDRPYYQYYKDIKPEKVATRLFFIFTYILLIFYAILFATNIWFRTEYRYVTIKGSSMQPTLNPNPIYVDGSSYQDGVYIKLTQDIDYDDIIIIDVTRGTDEEEQTIIKRTLGLEGDKISIAKLPVGKDGKYEYRFIRIKEGDSIDTIYYQGENDTYVIYEDYILSYDYWSNDDYLPDNVHTINGVKYEYNFYQRFLKYYETETHNVVIDGEVFPIEFYTVGQDEESDADQVFFMGDNRTGSTDAREIGTVDQDDVVGKVVSIVRNGYSIKNSAFGWVSKVIEYLKIIWDEILRYFGANITY